MEKQNYIKKTIEQLNKSQKEESQTQYTTTIHRKNFVVFPNVFSPKYFEDTAFFSKEIPILTNGSFLEIGCGTGVVAIFATLKGAQTVTATDINPDAVANTKRNVELHSLTEKITVLEGDIFTPVKGRVFDQIFWNVPFLYSETESDTLLGKATFDFQDQKKITFIKEAQKYLSPEGKLYIGYSSNYGNIQKILTILKENNYSVKIIAQTKKIFADHTINLELIEAIPKK